MRPDVRPYWEITRYRRSHWRLARGTTQSQPYLRPSPFEDLKDLPICTDNCWTIRYTFLVHFCHSSSFLTKEFKLRLCTSTGNNKIEYATNLRKNNTYLLSFLVVFVLPMSIKLCAGTALVLRSNILQRRNKTMGEFLSQDRVTSWWMFSGALPATLVCYIFLSIQENCVHSPDY